MKEAILAQYSGAVEESSDDEDTDGDGECDEVCIHQLFFIADDVKSFLRIKLNPM